MQKKSFGDFVKYIKESRNLSASKLATLTGNKSKTSVLRVMEDKCSHKTMVKFAKLLDSVIPLTEDERDEMNCILGYDNVTLSHSAAMENLKFLYTTEQIPDSRKMKCVAFNSQVPEKDIAFENVFDICHQKKCTIVIENVLSIELVKALHNLIHCECVSHNPEIIHFFCDDDNMESKSIMVMCLFKLATYREYSPFECKKESILPKRILIMSQENESYEMRVVNFTDDNEFYFTDTSVTKEFYNHLVTNVEYRKKTSFRISKKGTSGEHLAEVITEMGHLDKKPSVQIETSVCYMMIPFKTQLRLYEESGWLGLGKSHPLIKKLYKVMEKRMEYIETQEIPRKFVWTEDGVRSFMETGKACDHFKPVGGLTPEERKTVLEGVLNKPWYDVKILKPDYCLNDTEFHVFDEKHLIINDSYHGWWGDFSTIFVNDKRVVRLVSDFYHNELWEKYCYTVEESREIVKKIIQEYK